MDCLRPANTETTNGAPLIGALQPLDTVDVHDPQMTAVRVARLLQEFARALNYATLPRDPRLRDPADVYMVLESLQATLSRLPQACDQLALYLQRQRDAGVLHAERGFPHAGTPAAAVREAVAELEQTALAANVAAAAFGRAHNAISGLSQVEPAPTMTPPPRRTAPGSTRPSGERGIHR